jgi:hypothetical protein
LRQRENVLKLVLLDDSPSFLRIALGIAGGIAGLLIRSTLYGTGPPIRLYS